MKTEPKDPVTSAVEKLQPLTADMLQPKPPSKTHESFLIVWNEDGITRVYRNGLPVGEFRDGQFHITYNVLPDGTRYVANAEDKMHLARKASNVALIVDDAITSHLKP